MQQVPIRCCNAHTRGRHHARPIHRGRRKGALQVGPSSVWPAPVELLRGLPRAQFAPWPKSRCRHGRSIKPCGASASNDGRAPDNLTVVQLPVLNEALATLGCAPIVCNARGSFHGSNVNTFHTRKSVDASDEKIRCAYGTKWKNTAKQRAAMLYSRRR